MSGAIPKKRARHAEASLPPPDYDGDLVHQEPPEGHDASHAGRAGLACEACRMRKTRCVGFPVCTWCQHRRQPCVRGRNTQISPLDAWGQQLLGSLALARQDIISALARDATIQGRAAELGSSDRLARRTHSPQASHPHDTATSVLPSSSAESILTWDIWKDILTPSSRGLTSASESHEAERPAQSKGTADTSVGRLKQLRQRFERKFLHQYPVVSPARMHRYVLDVAESDGDWAAESCLVFMACAIALRCSCCSPEEPSSRLALQYWTMARRRLGWALDAPSRLLGVQCLCLAGFWHLEDCAPKKARRMFLRAAESALDGARCADFEQDEMPLAGYVHLLCSTMAQRLSYDIGIPSPDYAEGSPFQLAPRSSESSPQVNGTKVLHPEPEKLSDITTEVRDYGALEKSIHSFLASPPDCSRHETLDMFLCHIAQCRLRLGRLQHMWPVGFGQPLNVSVARDTRNRRLTLLLLRACLGLYLTPRLPDALGVEKGQGQHPQQKLLNELAGLANECIVLASEALRSHLAAWETGEEHQSGHSSPFQFVETGGTTGSNCHHLEALLAHRAIYAGCLALLAAHLSKEKAASGDEDFAHCLGLKLPVDCQRLVSGNQKVFSSHEEGGVIWQCGKTLSIIQLEGAVVSPSGSES